MSAARISLLGIYRYDNTIFDRLVLPSAPWSKFLTDEGIAVEAPDKEVLIAHILKRTANLEIFYPNAATLKSMIYIWSTTNKYKFKRLWENIHFEYNPLWNKDANYNEEEHYTRDLKDEYTENTQDETNGKRNDAFSGSENEGTVTNNENDITNNLQEATNGTKNSTTKGQISSFNTEALQDRDNTIYGDTTSETKTNTGTVKEKGKTDVDRDTQYADSLDSTTKETETGKKDSVNDATGTYDILRKRREYGNIGVTTNTQMLKEDRELSDFNWYDMVCDSFIAEFCISVY